MEAEATTVVVRRGAPKMEDFKGPKKPPSGSYFSWCNDNRERVTKELKASGIEGSKFIATLGKTLADKYKVECTDEQKAAYTTKNQAAMMEYNGKMKAWKETPEYKLFEEAKAKFNKKKGSKEAKAASKQLKADAKAGGMPSKPLASYFIFVNAKRDEISADLKAKDAANFKIKMVALEAGKMWKAMTPEEKKPWEEQAAAARAKFDTEMAAWKETDECKKYEEAAKLAKGETQKRSRGAAKEEGVEGEPKPKAMRTRKAKVAPEAEKTETTESTPAPSPATTEATVEESPAPAPVAEVAETGAAVTA